MNRGERIGLWVAIGVLGLWLLLLTVMTVGEFAAVNRMLQGQGTASEPQTESWPGTTPPGEPTPWWGGQATPETTPGGDEADVLSPAGPPEGIRVGIAGVRVLSDTVAMTVTVRSSGAGDLLYEPPVLVDEAGRTYLTTPDSLEAARLAFLDLVTRGQAVAELVFAGAPAEGTRLMLVFNPNQEPTDILAPRVEVLVPVIGGE